MTQDNLHTGINGRTRLASGVKKIADAIGATMGTSGSNSIIQAIENPGHLLTNDGFTIASSIHLADPIEEMGRKILLEAISRANKVSGDGSSTTTVLCARILEEGVKATGTPMEIKKSLEACIPVIESAIDATKREITVDEVGPVAAISAEDAAIGALIQEIYQQIGKTGIVYWDISKTAEDSYTIGSGITIDDAGVVSPYMCDIDEKTGLFTNVAKWKNASVLIAKQKIVSGGDFNALFQKLNNSGTKEVVIFCDEYEAPVVMSFIETRMKQGFKTLMIKMPTIWKDQWYEDVALATGATVIDPALGISFATMNETHLGKIGNIVATKDTTYLDGIRDLSAHIATLEADGTDDSKLRASRLNTKTARLYVGAHSDSALSYKRLKVEDAIAAAWHALNGGIVAGGGVCLRDITALLPDTVGGAILKEALCAPYEQILKNADIALIQCDPDYGFDTSTLQVVNMYDAHITDPAIIVKNAVKNAVSVAASILTAQTIVTFPHETV